MARTHGWRRGGRWAVAVGGLIAAAIVIPTIAGDDGAPPDGVAPVEVSTLAEAAGLAITLEPGWREAGTSLTPRLISPKERLSIGTFPMKPGGRCSQLPSRAYAAMGPTDAMITFMERGSGRSGYPPRPRRFDLDPRRRAFECVPRALSGEQFAFRDAGRNLYAFVVIGRRGPLAAAERTLNTLIVAPR
jgi:hypothetical protein